MNHLNVEKLNTQNRDAALSLINGAYANVRGFQSFTMADLIALEQSGRFALGFYGWQTSQFRIRRYGR